MSRYNRRYFGMFLRDSRVAWAMSQSYLAGCLGVSRETLSRWENGHRAVPMEMLPPIAALTHGSVSALITALEQYEEPVT